LVQEAAAVSLGRLGVPVENAFVKAADLLDRARVVSIAFSPDGNILASANDKGEVRLWDARTGELKQELEVKYHGHCRGIAFSPDGRTVASGWGVKWIERKWVGEVWLFNARSGKEERALTGHARPVACVAFSPDGKSVASGSEDRTVRIWDEPTRELTPKEEVLLILSSLRDVPEFRESRLTLKGHKQAVFSVAFSPDSLILASGEGSGEVRLWDARTGTLTRTLTGHESSVTSVAFSPDGRTLASVGREDSTVRLWDVQTGRLERTLTKVTSVAFSPDGEIMAAGSEGKTVQLHNARTGELQETLTGHAYPVTMLAFSPDGKTLASASGDTTVKLWRRGFRAKPEHAETKRRR
jgi:WD40 repeat protein